jgi:UDP-glucose 4-epimerase
MNRVLVTGGAGFVGSHVADAFLAAGSAVTVLDNLTTGKRENVPIQAELIQESIGSPAAAALVGERKFDVIVHCAAQMDVRRSVDDPILDATTNIVGTLNLMEAVRAGSTRTRIVFTSTGGALYGDFTTPPNEEEFAKEPEAPYAVSKLAGEYYLAYYARVHGLDTVALRLGNVYGPRQDPHGEAGVVAIFCGRIVAGQPLTIVGSGEQTRDYIYVGDVVRAIQLAAQSELPRPGRLDSRAFNVGTGEGTSVNELASLLQAAAGSSLQLEHVAARPGEQMASVLSVEKAANVLGWKAEVPLPVGLRLTFQWFAERAAAPATPAGQPPAGAATRRPT